VSLFLIACSFLLLAFIKEAIAVPTTSVSLTITKVKCIADCRNTGLEAAGESAADFYALININGVVTRTPRGAEDQTEITPNWKVSANIPTTHSSFPVSIQIWDHDSTSGDDLGDASPVPSKNNLDFTVDRVTGQWKGDINWPQKCAQGGNPGDEPAVEVCFEVGGYEDTDGDGLLDDWEKNGLDVDSDGSIDLNLPAWGANPLHKDIFLELDWMTGQNPARQAIQAIKAAFAAAPLSAGGNPNPDGKPGINLWVDTGALTDPTASEDGAGPNTCNDGLDNGLDGSSDTTDSDCLVGDNLEGGNAVPVSNISGLVKNGPFYTRVKQNNFDLRRSLVFHYGLSAVNPTNNTGTSTGGNNATTLNDTTQAWVPNEWSNRTVTITGGTGFSDPAASEDGAGPNTCNDGIDNGPDGLIDANDPNCNQSPRTITANNVTSLAVTPAWSVTPDATSTYTISLTGGHGEVGGNDFVEFNHDPGTIMHELGHNLNLQHGGNDPINCKPNYVSVMNYDQQFGIQQTIGSTQGQDFDGNGTLEIIDYSPPRFPGGRGTAPLPRLVENNLNEATILDSTDAANQLIYTSAGGKFLNPLNQRINWNIGNGDLDTNDSGLVVNINTAGANGRPAGCVNTLNNQTLDGYNDWDNIVLNFRQFGDSKDAPINPVIGPEPTLEDRRLLQEELNTTDLEIIKSDSPDMAVAGQELVYTLTIKNKGPRLARNVQVVDTLPKQVTHISNNGGCVVDPSDKLTCNLGELSIGESREIRIRVHIAADLPCKKDDQFFILTNNANVVNLVGPDSQPRNNAASENTKALCIKYEYAARLICGMQKRPKKQSLLHGLYATSISIHNPNDEKIYFFKKLALTYPPEEQKPGNVMPIAIDTLKYDEALNATCDDIQKTLFEDKFPTSYIDGFVIIQSPRSLDVTGVYTTANLGCCYGDEKHSGIHIEQIRERKRNRPDERRPDLVVSKIENLDVNCLEGAENCVTQVRVTISNIGSENSTAFDTAVFDPGQSFAVGHTFSGGLAAGASQSFAVSSPPGESCFDPDCTICVTVDKEDDVLEYNEANNELCVSTPG
jgi:uncharacterized repeat protein (TIGR01451 family)